MGRGRSVGWQRPWNRERPGQIVADPWPERPTHPEAALAPWLDTHGFVPAAPLQSPVTLREETHASSIQA